MRAQLSRWLGVRAFGRDTPEQRRREIAAMLARGVAARPLPSTLVPGGPRAIGAKGQGAMVLQARNPALLTL